jgi:hypothetical protein
MRAIIRKRQGAWRVDFVPERRVDVFVLPPFRSWREAINHALMVLSW